LGAASLDESYLADELGLPVHVAFVVQHLVREEPEAGFDRLSSLPFYSLCRGLFLPLSSTAPERAAHLFGFAI
jgi:DNA ligase-1